MAPADTHPDSFGARSTLSVGGRELRDLPARRAAGQVRRGATAVRTEDPAREPAPLRGRRGGHRFGHREARALGGSRRALERDRLHPEPGADAGLHRRPGDRRPRGDARRDRRARRRSQADQSARPGRARDRPLDPGRQLRRAVGLPEERRARVRAQPRALRVPSLGADGVRQLLGGAAEHRHLPPGQPRVPRARGDGARRPGVPRHARRDRLPHDDGQRARRARAGGSVGSRPRRRCSASRSRCSCPRSSASSSSASCRRARRRPTSS